MQDVDVEERGLAPAEHEENEVQQHDSCAASSPRSFRRGEGEEVARPGHNCNPAADDDDAVAQTVDVDEDQKSQQLQKQERAEEAEAPNQEEVLIGDNNPNPSEGAEAAEPIAAAQVEDNQMHILADFGEQLESAHSSPLSECGQRRMGDEVMEGARRGEFPDSSSSSHAAGCEVDQELRQMEEAAAVEPPAGLLDEVVQHDTGGISSSRGATSRHREVLQEPAEDVEMKDSSEANEEPSVVEQDGGALLPAAHEGVPAPAVRVGDEQPSAAAAFVLAGEAVANERSTTKAGVAVVSAEEVQEEMLVDEDARPMAIANEEEVEVRCSQPSARMSCEDAPKVETPLLVPDQDGPEEDDCLEEELVLQVGRNFLSGNIKVLQRRDYMTERTGAAASSTTSHKRPAAVSTSGIISGKLERLRNVDELQEQPAAPGTNKADFAIANAVVDVHVEKQKASPPVVMVSGGMEFLEALRDRKLQYLSQPAKFTTTSVPLHSSAVGIAKKMNIRRATSTLAPMPAARPPKDGLLSSSSASSSPSSSNSSASSSPRQQEVSSRLSGGSSSSSSGDASRSRASCNYKSMAMAETFCSKTCFFLACKSPIVRTSFFWHVVTNKKGGFTCLLS